METTSSHFIPGPGHTHPTQNDDVISTLASLNVTFISNFADVTVGPETTSISTHTSLAAWKAGRWVLLVFRPLCAVFGVVGNALSVTVILKSPLRKGPSAVYMVTLALQDMVLSVIGMVHVFPTQQALGEENVLTQTWHCKAFYFTLLFTAHWDTLTLVAMTAQRYVAIGYPLRAARWNRRRVAVIAITIAAIISFSANCAYLFLYTAMPYTGQYRSTCGVSSAPGHYWVTVIYPWLDWTLYSSLPILAICVFNILIFRAIRRADALRNYTLAAGLNHEQLTTSASDVLSLKYVGARGSRVRDPCETHIDACEKDTVSCEKDRDVCAIDRDDHEKNKDSNEKDRDACEKDEDAFEKDRDVCAIDRDNHEKNKDSNEKDRDTCEKDEDAFEKDRDVCATNRDDHEKNKDACEKDRDVCEKDEDASEKDEDAFEKDRDVCEKDEDASEKDEDACEKDRDVCEKDEDASEKDEDAFEKDRDVCATDRDDHEKNKDACEIDRDVCEKDEDVCEKDEDACENDKESCENDKDHCEQETEQTRGRSGLSTSKTKISADNKDGHNGSSPKLQTFTGCRKHCVQPTQKRSRNGLSTFAGSNKASRQLTRMLVCVSIAFVVLSSPIGIFIVVSKSWKPSSDSSRALFSLVSVLCESLMYTNHAVNFVLYCVAGSRFRRYAANILCRRFVRSKTSTNHSTDGVTGL
ncbi:uncharacterized protein [Littorina saxatilis]|uniref:G-protein coupled receptors family 1 profile domain-containing protein n=1 Tax=Littorina saxatilis TaxID=31220 RepID=A0AAN9AX01_9CAEN